METKVIFNTIERLAKSQVHAASVVYSRCYNNDLYHRAIKGRSVAFVNTLIDHALALCGDPHHKITRRRWSAAALEFLAQFERAGHR